MKEIEISSSRQGMIDVPHGKIFYEYFGEGNRPVLITCNGINQTTESWRKYLPQLTHFVDVLAWDYSVQGQSLIADGYDLSIDDLVIELEMLLAAVVIEQQAVFLLGMCFGSTPALEFTLKHPQRVKSLVLTGAIVTREEAFIQRHRLMRKFFDQGRTDVLIDMFMSMMFGSRMLSVFNFIPPDKKQKLTDRIKSGFTPGFTALLKAQEDYLIQHEYETSRYSAIESPTLLISGDEDLITLVKYQLRLKVLLKHCEYREYEGAGHLLYIEQEQRFFDDVINFLCA